MCTYFGTDKKAFLRLAENNWLKAIELHVIKNDAIL